MFLLIRSQKDKETPGWESGGSFTKSFRRHPVHLSCSRSARFHSATPTHDSFEDMAAALKISCNHRTCKQLGTGPLILKGQAYSSSVNQFFPEPEASRIGDCRTSNLNTRS